MSSIQPIATTRITDAATRNRLTAQIQRDQQQLFKLQNQLSTGYRIFLPSDDVSAAQRAIELQRTIERNAQSQTNLEGARTALTSAEQSTSTVSDLLNGLKSQALNAVDSFASETERDQLVSEIDTLLETLTGIGKSSFTGSYLFGGSEIATAPFDDQLGPGKYIEYGGDETAPQTFVDIGLLFDQALPGDEVFGGLSEAIRGTVDVDPQPSPETRLSQLNGGAGVSPNGSVEIVFDPATPGEATTSAVIDLSVADTLADVARLLEENAPDGADLTVTVEGEGLLVTSAGGSIGVREVAGGSLASELGILQDPALTASISGQPLNPTLRPTTPLSDLDGTKARGLLTLAGTNNDLSLVATTNGAALNGLTVDIVGGVAAGSETAAYDGTTNTLTISIADGESTAAQIAAAINDPASGVPFTAETDYRDATTATTEGEGTVAALGAAITNVTAGGSGTSIDTTSGLRITNGAADVVVDTSSAETLEDLVNLLNDPSLGLAASINATGDGIDVRTRRSGADFAIGENGGTTAADLGIRTYTGDSRLADFNRGLGVYIDGSENPETAPANEFRIELRDNGTTQVFNVDLSAAVTVQDAIDAIAADTGGLVTASLATTGNGLVLARSAAVITDPAAAAQGALALTGDAGPGSLEVVANTPGAAANRNFTIEFTDSGAGGLTTLVTDDAIVVDYGGATPDTDAVAASIDAELAGYTVTSTFAPADTISAPPAGAQNFFATGGFDADQWIVSGDAAERLGFVPEGQSSVTSTTDTVSSTDRNPREVESVFNTLLRMQAALESGDEIGFAREVERLDDDLDRTSFSRSEIGVRIRNLDSIQTRLSDEEIELRSALSIEIDADLVEVITDYTTQQASLEASLQVAGSLLSLSILDFI